MSATLSPNTQAILLLTAPLLGGGAKGSSELLSAAEYQRLALALRERRRQPADLLADDPQRVLDGAAVADPGRITRLLARGLLLSQAVERWQQRGIWVVSRADAEYPSTLKARLKEAAPAILYGCGNRALLQSGGLAVVGSRDADPELLAYATAIGELAADGGATTVSGGARGIDSAAMLGALRRGGRVVGVLADGLAKAALHRDYREGLREGRLALVSPWDPDAGFNVGHAMQRNKMVYALASAALVVSSDVDKGGTWAGATEQLERLRLVPVFVRSTGNASKGLDALRQRGALPWPNPADGAVLAVLLRRAAESAVQSNGAVTPGTEAPVPTRGATDDGSRASRSLVPRDTSSPADELYAKVRELLQTLLRQPKALDEVAAALQVKPDQAELWMHRLKAEGVLEHRARSGWIARPDSGADDANAKPTHSAAEVQQEGAAETQLVLPV